MTAAIFCATCIRDVYLAADDRRECPVCLTPLVTAEIEDTQTA